MLSSLQGKTPLKMSEKQKMTFSPLDGRYRNDLPWELSEEASLFFQLEVEKAWFKILIEKGLSPKISDADLNKVFSAVTQEKIDEIEKTTRHATRALVEAIANEFKAIGQVDAARWVHVGLTSFDTVDTAQRLRLRAYLEKAFQPALNSLKKTLRDLARKNKDTLQCGRTHGQWAVPTLFGLVFAKAHERISQIEVNFKKAAEALTGKSSGAIGGYHASGLLFENPIEIETEFLKKLNLRRHLSSTQILPPEDLLSVAQLTYQIGSVVAKLAEDLRHLSRSEIAEVAEGLAPGQVGSSTMPQKRNPWNFEHVCSLYKILLTKLQLLELDTISEHQRDLTNSASGRFYFEFFDVLHLMIVRLNKVLPGLEVFSDTMAAHVKKAGSSIFAEAFYVMATKKGVPDAHSYVREASREAEKRGVELFDVLKEKKLFDASTDLNSLRQVILQGSRQKIAAIMSSWED